ncbi:MAG: hypothetical protein QM765_25685 [Myxococcales bacterium]
MLLLALSAFAACGDDDFTGLPDGPDRPDTPEPDGPQVGLVKLTITDGGTPQPMVKVYFQNADSTIVSATMTDVNGVASAVMEAGGFVTAINPFPQIIPAIVSNGDDVRTFAGVKPLDELVLSRGNGGGSVVNVTLLVNPDPNVVGGTYELFAPCIGGSLNITNGGGSGSGSGSIGGAVQLTGCGATSDFTITVRDGNFNLVSSIHKDNVTLTEGQPVDLTDLTYVAAETATFQYTNAPAGFDSFGLASVLLSQHGQQNVIFSDGSFDNGTGTTPPIARPVVDNDLQLTAGSFGTNTGRHQVLEWGPSTTAYTKSLAGLLLAEYATFPTYDVATKTITWTVGAGADPDFAIARTSFSRPDGSGKGFINWDWEIVAPLGTEESIRYPVLPAPDDDYNPTAQDAGQDVFSLTTAKFPGGYDAIRETVFSVADNNSDLPNGIVTGATGTVVIEDLQFATKRTPPKVRDLLQPFAQRVKAAHKARRR